jgi:hypothetical protein
MSVSTQLDYNACAGSVRTHCCRVRRPPRRYGTAATAVTTTAAATTRAATSTTGANNQFARTAVAFARLAGG